MALRKSDVIVETARRLFLERGFDGTSMDDVAAASGASKTTVYNNFQDKQTLFAAVVTEVTARAERIIDELAGELDSDRPVVERLQQGGRGLVRGVLNPAVVQLRRIAVAEALRFPDLVASYWDRGPGRTIAVLEAAFTEMSAKGELDIPDTREAALQFAYAAVGPYQDLALLRPKDTVAEAEVEAHADAVAESFARAYAPRQPR